MAMILRVNAAWGLPPAYWGRWAWASSFGGGETRWSRRLSLACWSVSKGSCVSTSWGT